MQFCRDHVTGSLKGNILHPGVAAPGAYILVPCQRNITQVASKRQMAQCDAGVIVHMHLCAASAADRILILGPERTAEPDNCPAGNGQTGGCRLIHEAEQAGRNHQKFRRLCKYQLPIGVSSYIIQDRGSPFDWVFYIRQDAFPILQEDPFLFN